MNPWILLSILLLIIAPLSAKDVATGDILIKQGRYSKAANAYRKMLAKEDSASAHYGLAKALLLLGELEQAEQHAVVARQSGMDAGKAILLQSKIAMKQGQLDAAKVFFSDLLTVAPERPEGYLGLMEIAERDGDADAVDQWAALYQEKFKGVK